MRLEASDEPIRRRRNTPEAPKTQSPSSATPAGDVSGIDPLDAYVARTCPVKVQHRFAPPAVPPRDLPQLEPFLEAGVAHETRVNAEHAELVDVVDVDGGPRSTISALERGVSVFIGGTLPTDGVGRRVGRPDWLVRAKRDSASGKPGYWPVDIKGHKATQPAAAKTATKYPALTAPLDRPAAEDATAKPGWFERSDTTRRVDLLQLAHYWRMLEACGHAPETSGPVWGGIIGTENEVVWTDLTVPRFRATGWLPPQRTPGRRLSALELYDIEFAYRLDIARAAQAHAADPTAPLLVEPVKIGECNSCRWWPSCSDVLAADGGDISLVPGLHRSATRRLRAEGVRSLEQLAALTGNERAALAENGITSIDDLVDAAWLTAHGGGHVYRRRGAGQTAPRRADIEIDLDVEHDTPPLAYLWGALLTNRSNQPFPHREGYHAFVTWDEPSINTDRSIFEQLWGWLNLVRTAAAERGLSFAVYSWSPAERTRLLASARNDHADSRPRRRCRGLDRPAGTCEAGSGRRRWHERQEHRQSRWIQLARRGPGGMASVLWFRFAVAGDPKHRDRLIAYNEDDVRATRAVREWLTTTTLPSLPDLPA